MRSEWRKTKKTPAQLVTMLIVPLVSVLFLSWCMSYVHVMVDSYHATVYLPDEETTEMVESVLGEYYPDFSFKTGTREDAETRVHEGRTDCALVVDNVEVRILYDSSMLTSSMALKDSTDMANDLVYLLESEELLLGAYDLYPESMPIDLSTDEEKLESYFDQMAGLIGMILFLMMASNAMALSARTITGEKERQTFDTLVLCPAPLRKILLGKELVMFIEVFISGIVGLLAAVAGMIIWYPKEFSMVREMAGKNPAMIFVILLLLLTVTLVITGIFSIIGSAFAQAKKASLFSSAGMVIVSVAAILPNFINGEVVRFIPVANWTPIVKHLGKNEIEYIPVLTSLAIGAGIFVISMILSSGLWERTSE
jgi:hypothetical protein